jgi:hypothetical protein
MIFLASCNIHFFSVAQMPLIGEGLLIIEASRSHSDTSQSAGLPWMNDQRDGETSTRLNTTLTWDRHPRSWGDSNPQLSQTQALHSAATGIGIHGHYRFYILGPNRTCMRSTCVLPKLKLGRRVTTKPTVHGKAIFKTLKWKFNHYT